MATCRRDASSPSVWRHRLVCRCVRLWPLPLHLLADALHSRPPFIYTLNTLRPTHPYYTHYPPTPHSGTVIDCENRDGERVGPRRFHAARRREGPPLHPRAGPTPPPTHKPKPALKPASPSPPSRLDAPTLAQTHTPTLTRNKRRSVSSGGRPHPHPPPPCRRKCCAYTRA
eukprot:7386130-Prymnesium_polylepis.2